MTLLSVTQCPFAHIYISTLLLYPNRITRVIRWVRESFVSSDLARVLSRSG